MNDEQRARWEAWRRFLERSGFYSHFGLDSAADDQGWATYISSTQFQVPRLPAPPKTYTLEEILELEGIEDVEAD